MGIGNFVLVTDRNPDDVIEELSANPSACYYSDVYPPLPNQTSTVLVRTDCSVWLTCSRCGAEQCTGCKMGMLVTAVRNHMDAICFECIQKDIDLVEDKRGVVDGA